MYPRKHRTHHLLSAVRFSTVPTVLCALIALSTVPARAGVRIHSPEEIVETNCFRSGGHLFFEDAEGKLHELVTDIDDPVIANKGDGAFFPPARADVDRALASIDFPLGALDIEIYILPYPRRGILVSSAGERTIYLSPGVLAYRDIQVHSLIAHEIGHIVHNRYLPDDDELGWERYRTVRGIGDESVYHDRASHKNRPHEIFAEDFRFLFGGRLANYSNSIENRELGLPSGVSGLQGFFESLAGAGSFAYGLPAPGRLRIFPNPTEFGANIAFSGDTPASRSGAFSIQVFDVQGRVVAREIAGDAEFLRWSGTVDGGRLAPPGLYFVRVHRGSERWTGKVLVAR